MLYDDIVISGSRAMARSYAKINLTLDVLNKRSDGYHDVEMIMQTVSLYDLIIIDKIDEGIEITTNLKFLPINENNIAYKAARDFFNYTGISGGCKIMIYKNIPVAAGLAGGSGNAAAVLCALNRLYNTNLSLDKLKELGVKLGADVPFCITGGTALATGIGDIIAPLPSLPKCNILMVKPPVSVSTGTIYKEIDSAEILTRPDTNAMIDAIANKDISGVATHLYNVMGTVTENIHPIIKGIKNKMIKNGALGAVMSGSGPTVFGIFPDYETAKKSHDSFYHQFREVFIVTSK